MPGGSAAAWPHVKPVFQAISAKVDGGAACCDWVGGGGSGHYVKMVHNGIEYGDMQLICEAYQLMRDGLGMTAAEMAEVLRDWNTGELDSFLIEITGNILAKRDEDGSALVDRILDAAGQKGTGKWTVIDSANLAQPVTLIAEAVFARCVSAMKEERVAASALLKGPSPRLNVDRAGFIEDVRRALYASKIVSYAQGYMLMRAASRENGWDLNYGGIALMWRGGCIIRSRFLGKIKEAFDADPGLVNLMLDGYFREELAKCQDGWRRVVAAAAMNGVPVPAFGTALSFYDSYRCGRLPANLLQAQRDYFGAHTYERVDKPRGQFFHTNWTGSGGRVSSSTYNA
jgi:6-phosphogluconate dehydrogenase